MSFNIALSAINAINTELNTISNNIANSATIGFKSSRANFAAVYAGTQPTGTEVASLTQSIELGGNVISTGRSLDAAIQGRGFFVARDSSGAEVYTRVGIFSVDRDGYVVDTFGRRIQGFAATEDDAGLGPMGDLVVPMGQIPAQASERLQYLGNFSADWAVRTVAFNKDDPLTYNSSAVSVVYDSLGARHSVTQYFVKSGANEVTVYYAFDGDLLPNTGVSVDGSPWTVRTASDPSYLASVPGITITYIPADPATSTPELWEVTYAGTAVAPSNSAVITFSPDGQIRTVNGVPVAPRPYPSPADWEASVPLVNLDLGTPAGANPLAIGVNYTGTTQFAGSSATYVNSADGYASGALNGVQIEEDGGVMAVYSNGLKQRVGTIALATFPNEDALVPISDTAWKSSNASGTPLYSAPGESVAGTLVAQSLEQSNVDLTTQLVGLMSAQRNYQANSKVIATQNEMMQTLMQAV
ncbi:MAG: flagellar hook-basal body complex protein [Pseudomonadota bacterium]|jgi:fagellar hook-basal body proteins|nr:MAG: flagellar biosynthesis protein FlgE [Pseudomonadota bacterium]